MYEQSEKPKGNKAKSVLKVGNTETSSLKFFDVVKQNSKELIDNSFHVGQFRNYHEMVKNNIAVKQFAKLNPIKDTFNIGPVVIQLLKEGMELPSLEDQTKKHLKNKNYTEEEIQHFFESTQGVGIKKTLDTSTKKSLTQELKKTTIYKVLIGTEPPGMLFFENRTIGHKTQYNTITREDIRKYKENEYLPPDIYLFINSTIEDLTRDEFNITSESKWKDGKTLLDNVTENEDEELGYLALGDDSQPAYVENLIKSQKLISTIVEPSVLKELQAPQVVVHKKMGRGDGFRAYQGGNEVHIASEDTPDTIVHEVGHYLENNLNSSLYYDVALLREKRHSESIGLSLIGRRAAGKISDEEGESEDDKRGRYKGDYPATGPYTAKVYEELGATEVVSRTLEYLSTSQHAQELVEKDPQQALIILRRIRPNDLQMQAIGDKFKDYIPNKN